MEKNIETLIRERQKAIHDEWQIVIRESNNLFSDYWEVCSEELSQLGLCGGFLCGCNNCKYSDNCEQLKFKYSNKELVEKYKLNVTPARLHKHIEKEYGRRSVSVCLGCGEFISVGSRAALENIIRDFKHFSLITCKCGCIGLCAHCHEPLTRSNSEFIEYEAAVNWMSGKDYQERVCQACYCNKINSDRELIEKNCNYIPTKEELIFLAIFWKNFKEITKNGSIDFHELSFKVKMSSQQSKNLYEKLLAEGVITLAKQIRENGGINTELGRSEKIKIPENITTESYSKPIIPSPLAIKTFEILNDKFPYVFPEQNPATFIDFNKIKDQLSSEEKSWFFTKRIDFICVDEEYKPMLAVEYNGSHHFDCNHNDAIIRKFKENVCMISGIKFMSINSAKQLNNIKELQLYGKK